MIHVSQPSIGSPELDLVTQVIRSGQITAGPKVHEFEERFAELHNVRHAVACSSGTTALHLALVAAGIGLGDEVLVPDLTYVATANAVRYTGAEPVLVDIDPETWGIDAHKAEEAVTPRTRAILPVHLYGVAADMTEISLLASRHRLTVIEDAAEGLGGFRSNMFNGGKRRLGACSDIGCFSFYGNKIITTGEGGMVITDNSDIWRTMKRLRGMAQDPTRRYYHTELGFNYRLTDLQAAIGIVQLSQLEDFCRQREEVMELYSAMLMNTLEFPYATAPWLFTCLLPSGVSRDDVMARLAEDDIETRPTFTPLHKMAWLTDERSSDFPVSDDVSRRGISLPTWPGLSKADVKFIVGRLLRAL